MDAISRPHGHHHGNLRPALIAAGIELLEEGGTAALTLRKCAARAGVSHAAPAHHFSGMKGLLSAIAAEGHRRFGATMIKDRERVGAGPHEQLVGICEGYLRFARENDALFGLMFSSAELDFSDAELGAHAGASYQVLRDACAPFRHGKKGGRATELMVWSLVHGLANLARANCFGPEGAPAEIGIADLLPELELRKP